MHTLFWETRVYICGKYNCFAIFDTSCESLFGVSLLDQTILETLKAVKQKAAMVLDLAHYPNLLSYLINSLS